MQRRLLILLSTLVLLFNGLFAQNCPSNPTYKNTAGTYDLSAGRSVAVNNGTTLNITINNNFSSSSSICVTNGSTVNLSFSALNSAAAGGSIYVDATSKINLTGSSMTSFPFTVTNYGTFSQNTDLTLTDGAVINNYNIYTSSNATSLIVNTGTIKINNYGSMNFEGNTTFNYGAFAINNMQNGIITFRKSAVFNAINVDNKGTINFSNTATFNSITLVNSGYIYFIGTLNVNVGDITNYGVLNASADIIVNSGVALINYCTIIGSKNFTFNTGTLTNYGSILLSTNGNTGFVTQGTFINGPNGFVQGNDFTNNGNISGSGNFYFKRNTLNNGTFGGSASGYINFYDASNNGSKIFDTQSITPTFTTKNVVTPITTTNFTSCGEPAAPAITTQPQTVYLCSSSTTSATFSVAATSQYSSMTYQWKKNGANIAGATSSSLILSNLTFTDTANTYSVAITNSTGTTASNNASVHYMIIAQPSPATQYLATGNSASFSIQTSGATSIQWQKSNTNISNAISNTYTIPVVNTTDASDYRTVVNYNGGTCTSNTVVLRTSVVLYSKATGNLKVASNWGVETDGSGSTPVDFTRDEHTFVLANRTKASTGGTLTIAGTLDVANANVLITLGSALTVGRVIRSLTSGNFSGSNTSSLTVNGITNTAYAGASHLYFKSDADTLQYLTIAGHTVTLHDALNITAGSIPGYLQVNSGTFNTSDLLTLKSDASGTAIVASSLGTITGKVTVERFIPARRAWRLMCAPVAATNAPTINASWQEGATGSASNPNPGYGTHITYGSTADGFDQNPQKTFSLYGYFGDKWTGVPATNKTAVTSFPAYLFFIRGDRSYNILNTTSTTTALTTILRTTGNLNQGTQASITANTTGFTMIGNPYASPIDFEKVYNSSTNIKHTVRVWDPSLAGSKGVGAYVTLDWTGSGYKATPPSAMTNIIQPSQAFLVQSVSTAAGQVSINEAAKNIATVTNPFGRSMAREVQDAMIEINLRVFNEDNTTGITDGVLYRFNDTYNNDVDDDDVLKLSNLYENLSIVSNNTLLTIERRQVPQANDTLHLSLTGTKSTNYQLEIIPQSFDKTIYLYDSYLKTLSPINPADTNHFTISINTADAASKAASRFSIVMQNEVVLPVSFSAAKAYAKENTVQVDWKVADETEVQYYEVEKSANGTTFSIAGQVKAAGVISYNFNDASPFNGRSYYRIKSVDKSGKTKYSNILPVTISKSNIASSLSIYPNPLKGKAFQVQLSNKTAGTYTLSMISNSGQQLFTQQINHNGGTATYNVVLKNNLAGGLYFIKAIAADGTADVIKAIVE